MVNKQPLNIPGYKIISSIGKGGMGFVYKARQLSLDRLVAIKILSPQLTKDKSFIERFLREARTSAKLNHENIVAGIDAGKSDKFYYFVMEYVEGETLSDKIDREKIIGEKEGLNITLQIAKALSYAYTRQIVHRDIKPQNIMITTKGTAKLCDLGLAKETSADSHLTQTGMMMGTPDYLSPEQALGEKNPDIRSDIYSLGITLYHILTGEPPFTGDTVMEVITKRISGTPIPIRQKNLSISAGTAAIVSKTIARKKTQRYQTPDELIEDIQTVLAGQIPVRTRRVATASRKEKSSTAKAPKKLEPVYFLIGAGLFLVLVIVIAILFSNRPEKSSASLPKTDGVPHPDSPKVVHPSDKVKKVTPLIPYRKADEESLNTKAENEFRKLKEAADELLVQERFLDALKIYDQFPSEFRSTKAYQKNCLQEVNLIKESINSKFLADKSKASNLLYAKRYDEALTIYRASLAYATPEIERKIEKLIELARKQKKEYQEKLRKQAGQEYNDFHQKFESLLKRRKYEEAKKSCRTAFQSPTFSLLDEEIKQNLSEETDQNLTVIGLLESLFQDVESVVNYCIEKRQTVKIGSPPTSGKLVKRGKKIYLKTKEITLSKLSAEDITTLLESGVTPETLKDPDYHLKKGLFYYFEELYPEARIELEETQRLGLYNSIIESYFSETNNQLKPAEIKALGLYQTALAEFHNQVWEKAKASFSDLQKEYGKIAFVRRKQAEINNYLKEIEAKLKESLLTKEDIKSLFKGKVTVLDAATGKIEAVYRKSRALETDMYKKKIAGGMLLTNIWKGKMKGDVIVEFKGLVRGTRFSGIGLYYNNDVSGWYLAKVSLPYTPPTPRRPGRFPRDPRKSPKGPDPLSGFLSENAIGKIDPAGKSWQDKFQVLTSNQFAIDTKSSKYGTVISLKVSRIGKKISLAQGRTVILKAEDTDFNNGHICLVFEPKVGGTINFLSIKGTLDLEWAKKAAGKK